MLESLMPSVDDRKICCKCRARMGSPVFGYRCERCGQLLCRKCALSAWPHRVEQQPVSADCFRAANGPRVAAQQCDRASFKVSPLVLPDRVLKPPSSSSCDGSVTQLPESWQSSSVRSLSRSPDDGRNDEEDEGDDERNQFSTSVSVFSHDSSDVDSIRMSPGSELCNFSSANSSPLDSPCRLVEQGLFSPLSGKIGLSDQGSLTKNGAYPEDLLDNSGESICDNLEECYSQECQTTTQPLNFTNEEIFNPPPPKDKGDDVQTSFLTEEDDEVGYPGKLFESDSFSGDPLRAKDKSCEVNKDPLTSALRGHFRALVSQLLMGEGIHAESGPDGQDWLEIVSSLAWQAANFVKPDTGQGGSMDPGDYVKVKCVASGSSNDSTLVKGVVCSKNVKHKRMVSQHRNPRLLLLGGALECQKFPNGLSSIDNLLEQKNDYLKMALSKIVALRPNVLIVEKSVSSYAQEYLLGRKEVSLVINVKESILERISRCTGARIVPSLDCVASAKLGYCENFRTEKVFENFQSSNRPTKKSSTTLMFFEGCPHPLGCTVLLRGACYEELKKVKHVLQYASFAAYRLSLETSFLADEGAMLPKLQRGPSVAVPKKFTEADGCVPLVSNLDVLDHQSVCDGHQKDSSRSKQDILKHNSKQQNKYGDDGCFSSLYSEDDKVTAFRSTSDVLLSGSGDSCSGFQHEEPSSLSPLPSEDSNCRGDYLTPGNHQSILVSLSSTCSQTSRVCERSQLLRIKFYGSFDKPLGKYLLEDLFDETYRCRSCEEPTEAHVRCYTHQQGTLTIMVRRLSSTKLPGQCDRRIWMWHRCLKCAKDGDGVPPAARRVVMSDAAWGLSFGKFLELSFSSHATANRIASCGHSLQRDCLRFYGCGAMVAFFYYAPLDILSVCLPPSPLDFTCSIQQKEWLRQEAALVSSQIDVLHGKISDVLHATERNITASEDEHLKTSIQTHITSLKELLKMQRHEYDVLLQSVAVDILELNRLKRALLLDSYAWDRRLYSLNSLSEINPKEWREKLPWKDDKLSLQVWECNKNNLVEMALSAEPVECYTGPVSSQCIDWDDRSICGDRGSTCLENSPSHLSNKIDFGWSGSSQAATDRPKGGLETDASETTMDKPHHRRVNSSHDSAFRFRKRVRGTFLPDRLHSASLKSVDSSGNLASMAKDSTATLRRVSSHNYQREGQRLDDLLSHKPVHISSVLEKITQGTRLLLPQRGPDDIVIAVYDDEPTSIISYAMTSQDYYNHITSNLDKISERRGGVGSQANVYKIATSLTSQQLSGTKLLDSRETHFRSSFNDTDSIPSDKAKFSVTCYFAKQFYALRKKCCPSELDYIRSLSRCKRWKAEGGKSNVYFAKSLDERFIIKQVTKTEMDSFEDLAPQYFSYLMQCMNSGSPTGLAKILGIYQVAIKRSKGGREVKMDVLVMENLFFKKNISRIYDLKGSLRSRYNADTSGTNKVLLDMNLLETKPIFLGSKAKRRLERAIWNDTSFLATVDVMDYSLLVGVDEVQKELVVGIIDFMRQYTWDKQLETWVKAAGILGGPRNATPTVISPLEYKKRFRKAMSGYFLTLPEQ